ncbi:splicing factor 3A subunit 1-like [Ostrea edulis]|uniref:splicing factor 3A subunit 1-like n=1 Tax=Ostrea edulis TaxID=37623 RepID=UPI0024AF9273|nr:splicing factor 3A subunit 1-like [Ostrea edulis]
MPPVTMKLPTENQNKTDEELAVAKPVIGIIYPPPEVRNIVDKTASFVARNGPEFESRIRKNEMNNAKFNFLNPSDPYHAYYQHKVREFKEGRGSEPVAPKPVPGAPFSQKPAEQAKIIQEIIIPKEPPPEFEFIADPPSISAFDLDVVKLTAQFVARNGRQFLTNLMNREQRNYQFDFLRPQHSLFNYFTKLVEQYTKILIPPKDLLDKLQKESFDYKDVLNQVKYRVEWQRHQDREKRKEEEAIERERVAYAQIDWHDFVVVETVDFQPNESGNLPPPTTPGEVGARMLVQERMQRGEVDADEMEVESDEDDDESDEEERVTSKAIEHANMQIQDMEEGSDEEMPIQRKAPNPPQQPPPPPGPPPPSDHLPPLPPTPDQVIIRKNYDPKARSVHPETGAEQYMVSPITGEKILASKVQEHMRIGLLDPMWIKERQKVMKEKQEQEDVYAPGTSIEMSLKGLAERRTDIFGVGIEETQIGKKIGEEETKEPKKVVWDGHTASMEKVTQKARENISIEEQIKTIHKVKGFMQDEEKEKIGPNIPKNPPPPPKNAPPPPPMSKQSKPPPPPPHSSAQLNPAPLMSQTVPQRPLMVLPPRPPMPIVRMQQPMPVASHQFMPGPPQPPGFPPHMMSAPAAPPPGIPPPPQDDEPPAKKQKTEDQLIPEDVFLARNKGPVTFKVSVPKVEDKPEWNLKGQTVSFTLPLTDTISVMKAKLNESLGIPAGKQKLQYEGIFVKDSNSLAYYNVIQGGTIALQLKERGGRKK